MRGKESNGVTEMEATDTRTIALPMEQVRVAHAIAHAHRHLWAYVPQVNALLAEGRDVSAAEIEAATRSNPAAAMPPVGILAPSVNAYRDIEHVTGTGRTYWCVHPDGSAWVGIYRPAGVAIKATVDPRPADRSGDRACSVDVVRGIGMRHMLALARVLHAIDRADAEYWAEQEAVQEAAF